MSAAEKPDSDSTSIPKELRQQLPKYLAAGIIGLLWLIVVGFLQAYGEPIFDSLAHALGKKLLLQIGALLLCSFCYCIYLLTRKPKWKRSLYWFRGDKTPFCAQCFEKDAKHVHLTWRRHPDQTKQASFECWQCYVCNHDYVAWNGEDFRKTLVKDRIS